MSAEAHYFPGKLLWINNELYTVTTIGEKSEGSDLIPMGVEKVEW